VVALGVRSTGCGIAHAQRNFQLTINYEFKEQAPQRECICISHTHPFSLFFVYYFPREKTQYKANEKPAIRD
jgi:hypothetical protein